VPETGEITTIFLPYPAVSKGTWSWIEYRGSSVVTYPVAASDAVAKLSTAQPVLRQGVLQLTGAVGSAPAPITTRQRLTEMGLFRRKR
jgi:hypothetical protein